MSLREDVEPAFRAVQRRPALLLVGVVIGLLQLGLLIVGTIIAGIAGPVAGRVLGPFVSSLLILLTLPLYVGIYVPVVEPAVSPRKTLEIAARAIRRYYGSVLRADLIASAVAVCLTLGVVALWLVVSTGVRYARYAVADPGPPYSMESVYLGMVALFVGIALSGLAVRFADAFVAFEGDDPRTAWRASLRFARRRPLSLLGFGVVVSVLQLGPGLVLNFVADLSGDGPTATLLGFAVGAVLGGIGLTLAAGLHAVYFHRTVRPTVERTEGSTRPARPTRRETDIAWSRVAVAALILTASVGASVAVRAGDVRPVNDERAALPDDPIGAYEIAARNTARSNHRQVVLSQNLSDSNSTLSPHLRMGVDYHDRQVYVYFTNPSTDQEFGSYFADGTLAMRNSGWRRAGVSAHRASNWTIIPAPGYALADPRDTVSSSSIPSPDVNWTVVSRNASTFVLGVEQPSVVRDALHPETYAGMGGNMSDVSYLEVYVDRERAVVRKARFRLHSHDTGRDFEYRTRFEEVGTADLRRPPAIGSRGPLEWAWDVVYY